MKIRLIILMLIIIVIIPSKSVKSQQGKDIFQIDQGGIFRTNKVIKNINLVFTAHEFGDGGDVIIRTLKKQNVKGSFFFTGDFYRNSKFKNIIKQLVRYGHYLGAHSDKHLLYVTWENRDSLLVKKTEFINDLEANYLEMRNLGIRKENAKYFLPPYEWYNTKISEWTKEFGLTLINFTPGTSSNADYTTPDMGKKYISSDTIYNRILRYEKNNKYGLNGFILLIHFGTDEKRIDKLYNKLDELITELKRRGYKFVTLKETIGNRVR